MAIQFKTEEERKREKEAKKPKTKLGKAQKALFIFAIVATVVLFVYFVVCFNPVLVILPLLLFWFFSVIIPSLFTLCLIWFNDGFKNYVNGLNNLIGNFASNLNNAIKILLDSLPYVGSAMLLIIVTYGVLSFLSYQKNKEQKKYFYHLIVACVMFVISLLFMILAFVLLNK